MNSIYSFKNLKKSKGSDLIVTKEHKKNALDLTSLEWKSF
jgi:hypothetical protein